MMSKLISFSPPKLIYFVLITMLIGLGCFRIISTYSIFSQTWDEPAHIAAGLQWLDQGLYTFEQMHPPLARVMGALGLYLNGARVREGVEENTAFKEGNAILQFNGEYERNLTVARIGILPFFVIASIVVAVWGRNLGGMLASLLGTYLFTTLPPVLANAGIVTLDMASAASIPAAFFSIVIWLKKPSIWHSAIMGVAAGLAILIKFTSIYYLTLGFVLILTAYILHKPRRHIVGGTGFSENPRWIRAAAVAILVCVLTTWAGYRFSVYPRVSADRRPHEALDLIVGTQGVLHDISYFIFENTSIPAPEFFFGVYTTYLQNQDGRATFFLGEIRTLGWWYYYPVVFFYKSPLPFLLLCSIGLYWVWKEIIRKNPHRFQLSIPTLAAAAIFLIGMGSSMNLGIRQILSVYPLFAIVAGYGTAKLIRSFSIGNYLGPALVLVFLIWQLIASFAAHPDYLAYFNELAGDHPEEILVDSDLDWGQDLKRLAQTLKERGINNITISYHGSDNIDLDLFDLPTWRSLQPYKSTKGWVAISLSSLKSETAQAPYDKFAWLEEYQPLQRIGKSILLYYIP